MIYINETTGDRYAGGALTILHNGSLFSGIPTIEQLEEFGYEPEEIKPYETTQEELVRQRMEEIISFLNNTDYIVLKRAEGIDISSYDKQYDGNFLQWRQSLRNEYNQLEQNLNNI